MTADFNLSKPNRKIHAGVILMNSTTELLDVGVVDFICAISKSSAEQWPDEIFPAKFKAQALGIDIHWVNEGGQAAKLSGNLTIQPTDSFATCPPLDIVIMGAHLPSYTPNPAELAFIRKSYNDCSAFIAVCGGMQAPLQAGLFQGKTVTAPDVILQSLKEANIPGVEWVRKRYHRDGKLWTTGTLLNGLDAMRAFGTETWGGEGTLVERVLNEGHWPKRDVDYRDMVN